MKDFIKNNHLSFGKGRRNSTVTVLVGYAQHLKWTESDLKDALSIQIMEDSFIDDEVSRLWPFCKSKKYASFWKTKEAKVQYKF